MFATSPSERLIKYTVNTGNGFRALHHIYWFKHCQMGVTYNYWATLGVCETAIEILSFYTDFT